MHLYQVKSNYVNAHYINEEFTVLSSEKQVGEWSTHSAHEIGMEA